MTTRDRIGHDPCDISELPAGAVRMRALTAALLVVDIAVTTDLRGEEQPPDPLAGIVPFTENGAEAGAK